MHAIEPFATGHIDAALALWRDTEEVGLSSTDTVANLVRFLERNPGCSFVAGMPPRLTGAILAGHDGRRGYIHHLAVAVSERRRGLGLQLLTAALDALVAQGIDKCHSFVFAANPAGEQFWGRLGWQRRDDLLVYSMRFDSTG